VALAVAIGVEKITLFGFDFTYANSHHAEQGRACVEFYLGIARARGIEIGIPNTTSLMDGCTVRGARYYGYDLVDLDTDYDDEGRATITATARETLPTAEEIEAAYDHTLHPNAIVRAEQAAERIPARDRSLIPMNALRPEGLPLRPRPPPDRDPGRRARSSRSTTACSRACGRGLHPRGHRRRDRGAQEGPVVVGAPDRDPRRLGQAPVVQAAAPGHQALNGGHKVANKVGGVAIIAAELAARAAPNPAPCCSTFASTSAGRPAGDAGRGQAARGHHRRRRGRRRCRPSWTARCSGSTATRACWAARSSPRAGSCSLEHFPRAGAIGCPARTARSGASDPPAAAAADQRRRDRLRRPDGAPRCWPPTSTSSWTARSPRSTARLQRHLAGHAPPGARGDHQLHLRLRRRGRQRPRPHPQRHPDLLFGHLEANREATVGIDQRGTPMPLPIGVAELLRGFYVR
jgi:hypothetical protein